MKKWLNLQIKTSVRKMPTSSLHNMIDQSFPMKLKQKFFAINCDLWIQASLKGTDQSKNKVKLGLNIPKKKVKIIKSIKTLIFRLFFVIFNISINLKCKLEHNLTYLHLFGNFNFFVWKLINASNFQFLPIV